MREAAKNNIDTIHATEEDKTWANRFLYPDGRKPYLLFHNAEGYRHALELVAKARRATLDEKPAAPRTETVYQATRNGKEMPLSDAQMADIDKGFKEFDTKVSNDPWAAFAGLRNLFDRLTGKH